MFAFIFLFSCENKELKYIEKNKTEDTIEIPFEFTESDDEPTDNYNLMLGWNILGFSDGYIYFVNGSSNPFNLQENQTLWKYNIKTNNLTSVCSDPICKHNTPSCPLYAITDQYYIYNNKVLATYIYYTFIDDGSTGNTPDIEGWGGFKMYDMSNGKSLLLNEFNPKEGYTEDLRKLIFDDYCIYYDYVYNEKIDAWVFAICRWDMTTNKIVTLTGMDNTYDFNSQENSALATTFLFAIDSRIYFSDGKTIYSTDVNYENRIDHVTGKFDANVYTDGKYIYYGIYIPNSKNTVQSIRRMDFDGKNDIDLGINAESYNWQITSKYIYYKKYDEITIGKNMVSGYAGENIILTNSEIWRCNHDGTNHELVYKFEGDMANTRMVNEIYVGNYIYGIYEKWTDSDNDGVFKDGDRYYSDTYEDFTIMRINIETGEVYYIKVDI